MNIDHSLWKLFDPAFWMETPDSVQNFVFIISIIVGLFVIIPRYWASRQTAHATLRTSEISAAGHAWERFIVSMNNLRGKNVENKIAAVLAIRNFLEQNLDGNQLAMETLENYVREVRSSKLDTTVLNNDTPAAEIQSILTLLADQNSNKWRAKNKKNTLFSKLLSNRHPKTKESNNQWFLDLSNTDLRDYDLRGADLSNARLHNVNFSGANLYGANLTGADLRKTIFHNAVLSAANLSKANLRGASFKGASLIKTNLSKTIMWSVDLSDAHLVKAILTDAILGKAIFNRTQLQEADLRGGNYLGAKFINPNLEKATFDLSDFLSADINLFQDNDPR